MRRLLIAKTVLMILVIPAAGRGSEGEFDELTSLYLMKLSDFSPIEATLLGDHRADGLLDSIDPDTRAEQAQFCRSMLGDLAGLDTNALPPEKRIDKELLEHELRKTIFQLETLKEWEWNPLVYTALSGNAFYGLMARDFAPIEQRLDNVTTRLEQFARFLEQIRMTLVPARVPRIHAETAVKQNRGVLAILQNLVQPEIGQLPTPKQTRIQAAMTEAAEAVEFHQTWLEKTLLPNAQGNFRIGQELYDRKLAARLNSQLTRDDILERAQSELRRVRDQMYTIARDVYQQTYPFTAFPPAPSRAYKQAIIRSVLETAYADQPPKDRIVESARESLDKCIDFVKQKNLVTIPPDPVEIIVMPEFRRGVSLAYCDSPGPLDVGQKTFYAVAPLPSDWNAIQINSFLREYNLRSLHNLTVHEAMPGHFLQLAHSNRYPSTIRAVLSSGVFIEGWAVYAEQMMVEQGFLDHDPLMKLIVLKWYLRGIANAILDQSIHAGSMSRTEAMRLMIEDTFQEEREAAAKWIRAQLTSAQLSTYFVGVQEHWDLRRAFEKKRGEDFDLKQYHDRVISYGSPPVRYVRKLMLGR